MSNLAMKLQQKQQEQHQQSTEQQQTVVIKRRASVTLGEKGINRGICLNVINWCSENYFK